MVCGLTSQVSLLIQHDVLRFEVTVNYAVEVYVGQGEHEGSRVESRQ